jgi:hypothetical protein
MERGDCKTGTFQSYAVKEGEAGNATAQGLRPCTPPGNTVPWTLNACPDLTIRPRPASLSRDSRNANREKAAEHSALIARTARSKRCVPEACRFTLSFSSFSKNDCAPERCSRCRCPARLALPALGGSEGAEPSDNHSNAPWRLNIPRKGA